MRAEQLTTLADETEEQTPLPAGWRWVRVDALCDLVNGDAYKPTDWSTSGTPIIRIQNLNDPVKPFNYWAGSIDKKVKVESGDVLLAWSGTPGTSFGAHLWKGQEGVLNQHIFRVDFTTDDVTPEWFVYAANQRLDILINKAHGGVGLRHVKRGEVESLEIPLPPIEEQRRIATVLDEQMKAVEQARRVIEEQLEAAKILPSALLRTVFESEEAQDWEKRKLGEFLALRKEVVHPRDNPKGKASFVGLEHIESGTGRRIGAIEIEREKLTGRKPQFYRGDVVYGYLRPYLNKLWVAEFDGLCSVDQYVYSVNSSEADLHYLAYFMLSPIYLETAPIDATPGQLPRIRTEEVATVEFRLPPLERQRKVVEQLNDHMQTAENLKKSLTDQLEAIEKMPAAMLRKAFAGEV